MNAGEVGSEDGRGAYMADMARGMQQLSVVKLKDARRLRVSCEISA